MSKININSAFSALYCDNKLPRKVKKQVLGKRLTQKRIKANIAKIKFDENGSSNMEPFCPKCGCKYDKGTGNRVAYPEHWEDFHCVKCGEWVGGIDNSRFVHVLENR